MDSSIASYLIMVWFRTLPQVGLYKYLGCNRIPNSELVKVTAVKLATNVFWVRINPEPVS